MCTITCSNFLPRRQLYSYDNGRFLLTCSGQFLELFDLDKYFDDDYNPRKYQPIRTHVFESNNIECFTFFKDTGHVIAFGLDFIKNKLTIKACLVHRDLLLEGGYADRGSVHCLVEEYTNGGAFGIQRIPDSDDILVVTTSTLVHIRYSFSQSEDAITDSDYDVIAVFHFPSILPLPYSNQQISPLAIAPSSSYSLLLFIESTIVLLKKDGEKWHWRALQDASGLVIQTQPIAMMVPGTEIAVVSGTFYTKFISTSLHQKGVSKNQLRVIKDDHESAKSLATFLRDGVLYLFLMGNCVINIWKVQNNTVVYERNFSCSATEVQLQQGISRHSKALPPYVRRENKTTMADISHENPLSSFILRRDVDGEEIDLLLISYETGDIRILRTDDILKNPICTYEPLGKQKLPVQYLSPCWQFPLDPEEPLSQLIGLCDGIPILFTLEEFGIWDTRKFMSSATVTYSNMKSKTTRSGATVTVFYNRHDICFCFIDEDIHWKVDRLDCEITDCFLSSTFIVIATISKRIILVDILGMINKEPGSLYHNCSLDIEMFGFKKDSQGAYPTVTSTLVSLMTAQDKSEMVWWVNFKQEILQSIVLAKSELSRDIPLQDVFNREFMGNIATKIEGDEKIISLIDMESNRNGQILYLSDKGLLGGYYVDGTQMASWSYDIKGCLPKHGEILGFVTIQAREPEESSVFVLARDTEGNDIYLKDTASHSQLTMEPVPAGFGNNPIFGHFIGPKENGKCVLYTISTRKFGDVPELICVNARLSIARYRESLTRGGSLYQPDTAARLVPHPNPSTHLNIIVSSHGPFIEIQELSRMGNIRLKKEFHVKSKKGHSLFISSFDTYYVHSSNSLHIVAGASLHKMTKIDRVVVIKWSAVTNEIICSVNKFDTWIIEPFFFGKEHSSEPPIFVASVYEKCLQVMTLAQDMGDQLSMIDRYPFNFATKQDGKIHTTCTGNNSDTQDMWVVTSEQALLRCGRNANFNGNVIISHSFASWQGKTESILLLSTRNLETTGTYADFVFVVKDKCRIGILATMQKPGEIPTGFCFTELGKVSKTLSIAIACELVAYSADEDKINAFVLLYIARRKSVKLLLLELLIENGSMTIADKVKKGEIPTSIYDPSYIVVSSSKPNQKSNPKYCIISGFEGTETIRICGKLMKNRATKKERKESN